MKIPLAAVLLLLPVLCAAQARKPAADKAECLKDTAKKVAPNRNGLEGAAEGNFSKISGFRWGGDDQGWMERIASVEPADVRRAIEKFCSARKPMREKELDAAKVTQITDPTSGLLKWLPTTIDDKTVALYEDAMDSNLGDEALYAKLESAFKQGVEAKAKGFTDKGEAIPEKISGLMEKVGHNKQEIAQLNKSAAGNKEILAAANKVESDRRSAKVKSIMAGYEQDARDQVKKDEEDQKRRADPAFQKAEAARKAAEAGAVDRNSASQEYSMNECSTVPEYGRCRALRARIADGLSGQDARDAYKLLGCSSMPKDAACLKLGEAGDK